MGNIKISAIIKAIRARINYVPNRTNFLSSLGQSGGTPVTGEDIICSYIDAMNTLKERNPQVRRYCLLRAMYFSRAEIELIVADERSLMKFIENLNIENTDLSTNYREKWSKEKNIKKVLKKVVAENDIEYRGVNIFSEKETKRILDFYENDINKISSVFRKKYSAIDWEQYRQEAYKIIMELMSVSLSTLEKMLNRKHVMTIVRNKIVDMIRAEHKHHKNTYSLDKILEDIIINEDIEE